MPGDRARVSYDPTRQWRGTVAQQGRVTVEADLNETQAIAAERDRLTTLDVVGPAGSPDGGYAISAVPAGATSPAIPGDLEIGAGTLYLGGERLELDATVLYSAQPDWLDYSTDPLWVAPEVPSGSGLELVYLLAAEQEVSAVEDPALADVALGGPDTMGRDRILQHFVRTPASADACGTAWQGLTGSLLKQGLSFDPASMMLTSGTSLLVSFSPGVTAPSLCEPVATGGYLGAENQLIRVMVTSIKDGVPTIAWGYDNASFLYRLSAVTYDSSSGNTTVTLTSAPVDSYHYPQAGQPVEILRDAVQLTPADYIASAAGFLAPVLAPGYDPTQQQLAFAGELRADYLSSETPQPYLRVWQDTLAAPLDQAVTLGDTGLAVTLSSPTGYCHLGDFWTFAVRPIEPDIIYPARYLAGPQPPEGPRTWACPLAVLDWEDGSATATSCVPPFSSLTNLSGGQSCECVIDVQPDDLAAKGSFAAIISQYAGQGPITVCFAPGDYTLAEPLDLGPGLDGITLRACRGGVTLHGPENPGPEFLLGLIVARNLDSATIRGLGFTVPLVRFEANEEAFAGLPPANRDLLRAFATGLKVGFGISLANVVGLAVEDCTFSFPEFGQSNVLGAGVYAFSAIDGLSLTGCQFEMPDPPDQVPFNALASGGQTEPPYQVTFGYLQVPTVADVDANANSNIFVESVALLQDAAVERCLFTGVTVPMLAMARLGTLRIDQNTVRDCYGGFWLVSILDETILTTLDVLAVGDPSIYREVALRGTSALLDRIFVLATAVARVLPATPPTSDSALTGKILTPSRDVLDQVKAIFTQLYTRAADVSAGVTPDTTSPEEALRQENRVPVDIYKVFQPGGKATSEQTVPTADTGTSVTLRLDFCDCQVDAVVANSYSGAGLLVVDLTQALGSALVHGSRARSRFPSGETVMITQVAEVTVTGNIVANEVTPLPKPSDEEPNSYSITMAGPAPLGVPAVAITGNVFIDPTRLPPRPQTVPAVLADWDVLNTVISYLGPPAVSGISPASGPAAGGDSVTVTGSSFTGATGVSFGSTSATFTVDSDSQITATSPAGTGTVDVTVTTQAGTSAASAADQFTYQEFNQPAKAAQPAKQSKSRTQADAITREMKRPDSLNTGGGLSG
jgi:hypothetical protein